MSVIEDARDNARESIETLSSTQVAEMVAMHPRSVARMAKRGELPGWWAPGQAKRGGHEGEWQFDAAAIRARPTIRCSRCNKERDAELGFAKNPTCKGGHFSFCKACIPQAGRKVSKERIADSDEAIYRRNKSRYQHSREKPRYCPGKLPWNDEVCGTRLRYDQHANRRLCDPCERRERARHERRKAEPEAA